MFPRGFPLLYVQSYHVHQWRNAKFFDYFIHVVIRLAVHSYIPSSS